MAIAKGVTVTSRFHPEVLAELEQREIDHPRDCNAPLGACHRTAQKPNPQWCARPKGHEGIHKPEDSYRAFLDRARDRQREHRDREAQEETRTTRPIRYANHQPKT